MRITLANKKTSKTALITGATSGIGEEFARRYAKKGYRLILVGRRVERMQALAAEVDVPCKIFVADLSDEASCKELIRQLEPAQIDVFINNAGFGTCGLFTETSLEKEISMLHVNDIAMHILFKCILQKMCMRNSGVILNVASSAGLLPGGPYMATYYASKAYVASLTRAVASELKAKHSRVYVGALCPGPVDTEFNEHADVSFSLPGISVQQCVHEAMKGMEKRKVVIVPSVIMKLAMFFQKLVPEAVLIKITGRQQRKKLRTDSNRNMSDFE